MNMHVMALTPTEQAILDRSRAFHRKIALAAARLNSPKGIARQLRELQAKAMPAQADRPIVAIPTVYPPRDEEVVPARYPLIVDIKRAVAQYFKITVCDLESERRTADVILPRQIAMYLARTLTQRSLPKIGRQFGGRDHTTVHHAFHKMSERVLRDQVVAQDIAILTEQITGLQQ